MHATMGGRVLLEDALEPPDLPPRRLVSRRTFGLAAGASALLGAGAAVLGAGLAGATPAGATTIHTGFGTATIWSAQRQSRLAGAPQAGGHAGHAVAGSRSRQPLNMTFGDHVLVELRLTNETDTDLPFSAGQLRLRANTMPWPSVNRWNDFRSGLLAAGGTLAVHASYLVPSDATGFAAELDDLTDPGADALELPLPPVHWRPGHLEGTHA